MRFMIIVKSCPEFEAEVTPEAPEELMAEMAVHGRPRFAKRSIHDGSKVKIAPVHSDFVCGLRRCP